MLNYFLQLSELKKIVAYWSSLWGVAMFPILLNVSPLWEYILKGIGSLIILWIGVLGSLSVTSLYKKVLEPKIFKTKKDGNEKESDQNQNSNERAA